MRQRDIIKRALKQGAVLAAANWPVAVAQSVADGLSKLWIAVPLVGGAVLVMVVVGTDAEPLATADWRVLATRVVTSLASHRLVLAAFLLSLAVVIIGVSLFVYLVKAGTVGVLVRAERLSQAGEGAAAFSVETFVDGARRLFGRYARLGFVLMASYLVSGTVFVAVILVGREAEAGLWVTMLATAVFVLWTTLMNLLYLLVQIVIAAEDEGVVSAGRRVVAFLARDYRLVGGVFAVILGMVLLATVASLLAFAALGLVLVLPFLWLAAIPLQLLAVALRALVFQYIGLTSIGAYLRLYRAFMATSERRELARLSLPTPATVLEK